MRDEGMWVLGHGWGMVSGWVGPMVRYDEAKWRVWWWKGELRPNLKGGVGGKLASWV